VELRQYLEVLNRRKWLIVSMVVLVAAVAGVASALRPSTYTAHARVLLRPNDPAEQFNPAVGTGSSADPDRYVAAQVDIVTSPAVIGQVAKKLARTSPGTLVRTVSASQVGTSDLVDIRASSLKAADAARTANGIAAAYIENRRELNVSGYRRAVDDLNAQLLSLQQQIAATDQQINASAMVTAVESQSRTQSGNRSTNPVAPTTPGAVTVDSGLSAARDAAVAQYQTIFERQQELLINISLQRGQAEIVSRATVPGSPSSPRPLRDTVLGGFLGLLLGVGIAFVREHLDDRIRSGEDAEHAAGVRALAELPFEHASAKKPNRLAVLSRPRGALAEGIRSLRTSIGFLSMQSPIRTVLVTSAEEGDGKSLVAANLATAFAQAGSRTVLVGADLRRPRLQSIFGNYDQALLTSGESLNGFSSLVAALAAQAFLDGSEAGDGANSQAHGADVIWHTFVDDGTSGRTLAMDAKAVAGRRTLVQATLLRTAVPNLLFLPAGLLPPNPAELLGSRFTAEILRTLADMADIVILDAPPLLPVTDATLLGGQVDAVVLVAALGEAHRSALRRACSALGSKARVIGIVLNKSTAVAQYAYEGYGDSAQDDGGLLAHKKRRRARTLLTRNKRSPEPSADPGSGPPERELVGA
jgi:Mrp family chromosome partitioning ATPase/capsular polysaccharide biosynthesis protein